MTFRFLRNLTGAGLAVLLPSVAAADITADDVWNSQRAVIAALGGISTSKPTRKGDRLIVEGLNVTWKLPNGLGQAWLTSDGYEFHEMGDGTVAVIYPPGMTYALSVQWKDQTADVGQLQIRAKQFDVIASGDPDAITYALRSEAAEFDFMAGYEPPEDIKGQDVPVSMDLTMAVGEMIQDTTVTLSDLVSIRSAYAYGDISTTTRIEDAAGGVSEGTSHAASVAVDADLALPVGGVDVLNPATALRQGARVSLRSEVSRVTNDQTVTAAGRLFQKVSYTLAETRVAMQLDQSHLSLSYAGTGLAGTVEQPGVLPVPVKGALAAYEIGLDLPVSASETPQDANLSVTLTDLLVDDDLWAMIDAGGKLDRGPASFALDVAGKVTLAMDSFDFPAVAAGLRGGARLFEASEVVLNTLSARALGADVLAQGKATLDYDDTETYAGMPKPVGAVDVTLSGLENVLAQLTAAGLVSEQDVIGVRMMLGSFAKPDPEAPGTLRSHIEMTGEGQVLANGMRLR